MKKLISAILILSMLLALAACNGRPQQAQTDPTAVPTEAAAEQPTEAPGGEPTATPEPTAIPEPVELYFEDCSRTAAKLPWGTGDNEVAFDPRFEDHDDVPGCFCVDGGRIYILDRWIEDENSLIVYDTASGEISRVDVSNTKYGVQTEFVVTGGEIVTPYMIFDMETGEETLLQKPPVVENAFECVRRIVVRGGECYLYVSEPRFTSASEEENTNPLVTEYRLDRANLMWQAVRRYLRNWDGRRIQLLSSNDVDVVLERGTERGRDEYFGCDADGCHYVVTMDYRGTEEAISTYLVLTKFSEEGHAVSFTELRLDEISYLNDADLWYHSLRVEDDGTVWLMMMYPSELTFYKLDLSADGKLAEAGKSFETTTVSAAAPTAEPTAEPTEAPAEEETFETVQLVFSAIPGAGMEAVVFTASVLLPKGFEVRDVRADSDFAYLGNGFFTDVKYLYDAEGNCVGAIGANICTLENLGGDASAFDDPQAVCCAVNNGSGFCVDTHENYVPVAGAAGCRSAVSNTCYSAVYLAGLGISSGEQKTDPAVIAENLETHCYIVIELADGILAEEDIYRIAAETAVHPA